MDNVQFVHAFQASGYSNQLSLRSVRGSISGRVQWSDYQLQPLHDGLIPQVLLEIRALHVFIDETKGECLSRVNSHERYHVYTCTAKAIMYPNLIAKPLCSVSGVPLGIC